jgi:TM2 domain-containing membrane protein YozV
MDEPSTDSTADGGDDPDSEDHTEPGDGGDLGPDEAYCRDCGSVIAAKAEICPECGVRQRTPPNSGLDDAVESLTEGGNPFVAAVLSAVFPGLGQLYNRELEKGLLVIAASFIAGLSALILVGFVLFPLVWLYAVWDAYRVADRQGAGNARTDDEPADGD